MKRIKLILKRFRTEIISGSAAFGILFTIFCFTGIISISGQTCILTCDMYGQYYDFLIGIRKIILEQHSLIFSWNLDLGIGLIGWIAYYVTSPFNLVLLFLPESAMIWGITLIVLLKIASSAITFNYFLKRACKVQGIETIFFSLCYSLSSFAITYYFNIMWLDILILLPLLVLSMKKLIDGDSWIPFAFLLSVAFITNYYMSYMAGIFLFTCFMTYYIYSNGTILSFKFLRKFAKFVGSALAALGICSFVLIPTIYQMAERLGEGSTTEYESILNFDVIDLFQSATIGSFTSLNKGQPLIYCSVLVLILLPLYFLNHKISRREKICFGLLGLTWIFIMMLPITDLVMHIGNNPTCFPYRYTFVFIFLLCVVGARELSFLLDELPIRKIFKISGIFVTIIAVLKISDYVDIKNVVNSIGLGITCFAVLCYTLVLYLLHRKKTARRDCITLLAFILVGELLANGVLIYRQMDEEVGFKSAEDIISRQELLEEQLSQVEDNDTGYRIEKNYRVCYNDGLAYGFSSLSSFSSVYNMGLHNFMQNMGLTNQDWNSSYKGSTTFLDSIFGIRYIFHSIPFSTMVMTSGDTDYIEENEFCLPIGFMVNESILDYTLSDIDLYSPYEQQQKLLIALTGDASSGECFAQFDPDEISYNNIEQWNGGDYQLFQREDSTKEGSIVYQLSGDGKKEYYFYPQFNYSGDATKYVEVTTDYNTAVYSHFVERNNLMVPYNIRLFDSPGAKNDTVTLKFLDDETLKLHDQIFYSFDTEKYQKYYETFLTHSLEINTYEDGYFEGKVNVGESDHILFLSVPYNQQWDILVDGDAAEVIPLCSGTFLGVQLDGGEHTITAVYSQKYLKESIVISGFSIILIMILVIYEKLRR